MRKGVKVYSHDSNPAIDPPTFHVSRCEADARIEKGYAVWLTPVSIQTRPPGWTADEEMFIAAGVFREAWKQRWSGSWMVRQMVGPD